VSVCLSVCLSLQVDRRINLTAHIARAYGDSDASFMTITGIQQGSVRFSWTNNSLPTEPCPERQISQLSDRLISPDTGQVNPEFRSAMRPYQLLDASVTPLGACASTVDGASTTLSAGATTTRKDGPVVSGVVDEEDRLFLVMIIAASVIAVLLVILVVIICVCCCRQQRRRR